MRRARLSDRSRLLKGMLGRLLILGEGRCKAGATTWWVGHDTAKQIAGAVAQGRWGSLGRSCMSRSGSADVGRDGLHATRLKFVSQHSNFSFVAKRKKEKTRRQ